jgi:putative transposase
MLVVLCLILRSLLAGLGSRRELMLENLVLRHQLQVALRTNPRPRLRPSDRVLWMWLLRVWPNSWRHHLRFVRPETVLRWHWKGWRLYWTWKSQTKLGRPHLSPEVRRPGAESGLLEISEVIAP